MSGAKVPHSRLLGGWADVNATASFTLAFPITGAALLTHYNSSNIPAMMTGYYVSTRRFVAVSDISPISTIFGGFSSSSSAPTIPDVHSPLTPHQIIFVATVPQIMYSWASE